MKRLKSFCIAITMIFSVASTVGCSKSDTDSTNDKKSTESSVTTTQDSVTETTGASISNIEKTEPVETELKTEEQTEDTLSQITSSLDFSDEVIFEETLNNNRDNFNSEDFEGKTVKVFVREYLPDARIGCNIHSGEHLNFISSYDVQVEDGSYIIAKITKVQSIADRWLIYYDMVE